MSSFHTAFSHSLINHYIQYCTAYLRWRQFLLFFISSRNNAIHASSLQSQNPKNNHDLRYLIISQRHAQGVQSSLNSIHKPKKCKRQCRSRISNLFPLRTPPPHKPHPKSPLLLRTSHWNRRRCSNNIPHNILIPDWSTSWC
jgi:hypothetical protein